MAKVPEGCETGRVYLHGPRLFVDLDSDQYYRNDGIVTDLREWHKGIAREVGGRMKRTVEKPSYYKGMTGLCVAKEIDKKMLTFMAYKHDPFGQRFDRRTEFHEQAHALFSFGRPDILNDYMKRNGVCNFEAMDYGDKNGEEIAVRMAELFFVNDKMEISKKEILSHAEKWKWIPPTIRRLEQIGYVFT